MREGPPDGHFPDNPTLLTEARNRFLRRILRPRRIYDEAISQVDTGWSEWDFAITREGRLRDAPNVPINPRFRPPWNKSIRSWHLASLNRPRLNDIVAKR